ncbi:MAG: chromosome segregation protein SMC [Anaerolineae bacterium]|uniref:chromosome segregation protein SMC n=1 Tax=Candidatus Amarolinea dominans TaxID=3140696 RepID=UPI0031371111|nr:chromosome segregation protein SMC [Anaerolineae bacterium]
MRLKQLELQGYKSFANRTEFVFDRGVTAVIGPNGSGKSNVADAVRWVLGEQSFNLLRGKKTEDMIFSGSDQRARLGMAEVRLTLDNSDGSLPLDFAEVTITRRAFRSGENEYLLNGNRVRLKDIAELLGRSGLSRRTYTVIGQGLVDQVLSQRPDERRALFEEASGITGQQAKRDEALRRLDDTKVNLQRVQDLLQELTPRLRHLKLAADKANQARQLQADLHALLRTWYGYRWHTLLGEVERAQQGERSAADLQRQFQADLARLEADLQAQRARHADLRQHLGDWHRAASALHRQAETTQRELAVNEERQRQLLGRQRDTALEVENLQAQEAAAQERLQALLAAVTTHREAATARQAAVRQAEEALAARQADRRLRQQALEQVQAEANRLLAAQQAARAQMTQIGERQAALQKKQSEHAGAIAVARQTAATLAQRVGLLEAEQAAAQTEIQRLGNLGAEQAALAEQTEGERRQLAAALNDVSRESASLQGRFEVLTRLRSEGTGFAAGTRAVLADLSSPRPQLPAGILGTVASLIRVPSHLETALEVALGGQLQDIVVETWDVAEAAIAFLKRTDSGRATFLPLDTIRPAPPIPVPRGAGVLGVAADLVEAAPRLAPVVAYLLNRVVVTEDLAAARRVRQGLGSGPQPTLATLEGDLVRPGGSVSGGSSARNRQDGSVLAREREWREMPAAIEASKARSRQVESQVRQAEQKRQAALDSQRQLRSVQTQQEQQAATGREALNQVQRDLDRQRQAERWHTDLARQAAEESVTLAARISALQATLTQHDAQQAASQDAIGAARQSLAALAADDLDQALAAARAALATAQAQVSTQAALAQQAQMAREQAVAQAAARRARAAEWQAELERLGAHVRELTSQDGRLAGQIKTYQDQIEPAEAELAKVEATQTQQENVANRARQQVRSAEVQLNQARLELERRQDTLARLRRDIEHDFGLVQLEQSEELAEQPPLPLGALVETLPVVETPPEGLEAEVQRLRQQLTRLGNINPDAPTEYQEAAGRHTFLVEQVADLEKGAHGLHEVIAELEKVMEREFRKTFRAIAERFKEYFSMLFGGGSARLSLTDGDSLATTGIEIIARPPGKRPQSLALLSGGERALTAAALIFSVLSVSPPPFCILDEVDAALDEANVGRFRDALGRLARDTQFIVITHNRGTVEAARTIYGVSMSTDNASQVLSLRLEEVPGDADERKVEAGRAG